MQNVLRLLLITRLVGVGIFKPDKNLLVIMESLKPLLCHMRPSVKPLQAPEV